MWPLNQATRVLPVVLEDAVPNLLRHPRSPFVAELIGTNLFIGRAAEAGRVSSASIRTPEGAVAIGETSGPGTVYLTVSPREIMLSRTLPEGSPQNVVAGTVVELIPEPPGGERVRSLISSRTGWHRRRYPARGGRVIPGGPARGPGPPR